jgi:hypothetical protein
LTYTEALLWPLTTSIIFETGITCFLHYNHVISRDMTSPLNTQTTRRDSRSSDHRRRTPLSSFSPQKLQVPMYTVSAHKIHNLRHRRLSRAS